MWSVAVKKGFIKEQEVNWILSSLRIREYLNQVPLVGLISFWRYTNE